MSLTTEEQRIIKEAQRIMATQVCEEPAIRKPNDVARMLHLKHGCDKNELLGVVLLNTANQPLQILQLGRGIENRCHIYMKKVAKRILNTAATGLIFFHNHPSGSTAFSAADRSLHAKLKTLFELLEYRVLDHIIVTPTAAVSIETGELNIEVL